MNSEQLRHAGRRHQKHRHGGELCGNPGQGKGQGRGDGRGNGRRRRQQGAVDMTLAVLTALREHRGTAEDVQQRLHASLQRLIAMDDIHHALTLLTDMGYLGCEISAQNVYFIADAGRVYLTVKENAGLSTALKPRQRQRKRNISGCRRDRG